MLKALAAPSGGCAGPRWVRKVQTWSLTSGLPPGSSAAVVIVAVSGAIDLLDAATTIA
jgi:hypothetical protein